MAEDTTEDSPRKGKSNMIMTYEELANIHLAIQKVDIGVQRVDEKLADVGKQHVDHEVRLRALELVSARHSANTGLAKWLLPFVITMASLAVATLSYFAKAH